MDWHECLHPVWWLCHCLKGQARKSPRLTVRGPIISVPLPEGPGFAISADYSGPLTVTPRGNTHILLFADRLSRRADMFSVTAAEFTAEGTANSWKTNNSLVEVPAHHTLGQRSAVLLQAFPSAVYQFLGVRKLSSSSYHPNCNGGVERVSHNMAPTLAMFANEPHCDWDLHLPHVEFAYNNSASTATGLVPNEIHMGRLPRLPLTGLDRTGVVGHRSLARDYLAYCDLATDQQRLENDIVRAHHALAVSRVNRRPSALTDALRPAPTFAMGAWAWVYNSASTIRHGVKANTEAKVLKA